MTWTTAPCSVSWGQCREPPSWKESGKRSNIFAGFMPRDSWTLRTWTISRHGSIEERGCQRSESANGKWELATLAYRHKSLILMYLEAAKSECLCAQSHPPR